MFVRVFRHADGNTTEMVINVDSVWKIEIEYAVPFPDAPDVYWSTTVDAGMENFTAERLYKIFVGSEVIDALWATPNDPVAEVFADIYKNAIKN